MKPILYNTQMVRAILEGRKTVTRRVVRRKELDAVLSSPARIENPDIPDRRFIKCLCTAPYQPGDILWVRETWAAWSPTYGVAPKLYYKADGDAPAGIKWRPSIHMPKEAARLFLRVTDVRVELLLTPFFSDGAAVLALRQEGMALPRECVECIGNYGAPACIDAGDDSECGILDEIRGDFSDVWNSTLKPADRPLYGWDANPWVWVIEFESISKDEASEGGGESCWTGREASCGMCFRGIFHPSGLSDVRR